MDLGLERLRNMVLDMAELSQNTVSTAIDAYVQGRTYEIASTAGPRSFECYKTR